MERVVPIRRFASWLIDSLLFLAAGSAVLYAIHQIDQLVDIGGSRSVSFDLHNLLAIQVPLSLLLTYALWLFVIVKFGPPGRRLTFTEVRCHRGAAAGPPRKLIRAVVKILLHLSLIGFVIDAVFILRDTAERRSIPDLLAGTVIKPRRR